MKQYQIEFILRGNLVFIRRKKLKLRQCQLANKLSVSPKTISSWEVGNSKPGYDQLNKICRMAKITIDDILFTDLKRRLHK